MYTDNKEYKQDKRNYLRSIEQTVQAKWISKQLFHSEPDIKHPKYFVNAPIPYANGILHLGHAYTYLRADIMAKFKRMEGFNVLFALGCHTTGQPINAAAKRLERELKEGKGGKQIDILKSIHISEEDLVKFVDPVYWTQYFPPLIQRDLMSLGLSIDWRRSFITTHLNPYFDKFVKWQFNHLVNSNIIIKDTRYAICNPDNKQICNDHDRSVGEGIKPVLVTYALFSSHGYILLYQEVTDEKTIIEVKPKITDSTHKVYHDPETSSAYILTYTQYINMKYQGFEELRELKDSLPVIDFNQVHRMPYRTLEIYQPEETVISRTGEECCVIKLPQYFLRYGIDDQKRLIINYINGLEFCKNFPETKKAMQMNVDWLSDWACSRQFGLGTVFPLDSTYVIDSLSDSTIYMAYYTIAHLLQGDIFGKKTGILNLKPEEVTFDMLDFIFDISDIKVSDKVLNMRKEFAYWYPLDLRVSGKDLIPNHLTMTLYNHLYIWGTTYLPKNYACNGYINVNGEKMAKSVGNFLTVFDALNYWTADSIRLTLAEAGDTLNDANFETSNVNSYILMLKKEEEWILENKDKYEPLPFSFIDNVILNNIYGIIIAVRDNYEKMLFREVVRLAFHEMIKLKNKYIDYCEKAEVKLNGTLIYFYITFFLKIMAPIIPFFSSHLYEQIGNREEILLQTFPIVNVENKWIEQWEILQTLLNEIRGTTIARMKKRNVNVKKVIIKYYDLFPEWHMIVKNAYDILPKLSGKIMDKKQFIAYISKNGFAKTNLPLVIKNIDSFYTEKDFKMEDIIRDNMIYINHSIKETFKDCNIEFKKYEQGNILPSQFELEFQYDDKEQVNLI